MIRLIVLLLTLCLFTSPAYAHKGYHYIGLQGSAPSADTITVRMMMPTKPTNCKKRCHVIGWTILWDAYATGQYLEAGIGYNRSTSKQVTLWYATPNDPYINKVAAVPFGTWVTVTIHKPLGDTYGYVSWGWVEDGRWKEVVRTRSLPGWWGNAAYHPTKVEVHTKKNSHPGHVEVHFADIPTFEGDNYDWNIHGDGPWLPYGDFRTFTVR
jgi:hypothetical protein